MGAIKTSIYPWNPSVKGEEDCQNKVDQPDLFEHLIGQNSSLSRYTGEMIYGSIGRLYGVYEESQEHKRLMREL